MVGSMVNTDFNFKRNKQMKNLINLYKSFLPLLLIFISFHSTAQTGLSRATAFEAGSLYPGAIFTDIQNNYYGFMGDTSPFPNGIFYKFTLNTTTVVSISTCTSMVDTYLS